MKIIRFIALFSLILLPTKVVIFFKRTVGYICTYRFFLSTKSKHANGYIQPPLFMKGEKYISIGRNFYAGYNLRIECWDKYRENKYFPQISIGDNVCLNNNCHIGAINKIVIGDNVLIGSNVLITDHAHGNTSINEILKHPTDRQLISKGPVIIENDVWIGENVSILPGVHIGCGCIIGANSVVTSNLPSYCVCVGNPAKVIKQIIINS